MSLYLAIDTATAVGSVAVGEVGRTLSEATIADRRHASALVPAVNEVLRLAGAEYGLLAGIIVADGPGSFTGLRIGFSTARGILEEYDGLQFYTAPSLLAAAWGGHPFADGPVAALYDALRGEVFGAVYELHGAEGGAVGPESRVTTWVEPVLSTVTELAAASPVAPRLAVGDGAAAYAAEIRRWTGHPPVGPPVGIPRAGALLQLIGIEGAVTPVADPVAYEPDYGRMAEAQARWEREHGRPLPDPTRHTS